MLAATFSTPVVFLQMSECSIFVFGVIFPVLTHTDFLLHHLMPGYLQEKLCFSSNT